MKKFCLLLIIAALAVSSMAYADYSKYGECGAYSQKLERERHRLDNFEDEVVAPMVREMQRLKKTVNYRIRRPREIENKISKLENEIRKFEIDIKANTKKIELLTKEEETFETRGQRVAAGKKNRKIGELERQNIKKASKIERNSGEIDDLKEEAREIMSARPPLQRLEEELRQLEMQLEDQEQVKRHLIENLKFFESALGMCNDYQQLRMECGRN